MFTRFMDWMYRQAIDGTGLDLLVIVAGVFGSVVGLAVGLALILA